MSAILTTGSTVQCAHGGKVALTGTAKLTVDHEKAILQTETTGWTVSSTCAVVDDTSKGIAKCRKVASISTGAAAKLTVGGAPVMLASTTGVTDGKPDLPPPATNLAAEAKQTKLSAV